MQLRICKDCNCNSPTPRARSLRSSKAAHFLTSHRRQRSQRIEARQGVRPGEWKCACGAAKLSVCCRHRCKVGPDPCPWSCTGLSVSPGKILAMLSGLCCGAGCVVRRSGRVSRVKVAVCRCEARCLSIVSVRISENVGLRAACACMCLYKSRHSFAEVKRPNLLRSESYIDPSTPQLRDPGVIARPRAAPSLSPHHQSPTAQPRCILQRRRGMMPSINPYCDSVMCAPIWMYLEDACSGEKNPNSFAGLWERDSDRQGFKLQPLQEQDQSFFFPHAALQLLCSEGATKHPSCFGSSCFRSL